MLRHTRFWAGALAKQPYGYPNIYCSRSCPVAMVERVADPFSNQTRLMEQVVQIYGFTGIALLVLILDGSIWMRLVEMKL